MRNLRFCLLYLLMWPGSVRAAEFPPGAWNGQPWEAEKLAKGVAAGEADALAEWAYCSFTGRAGVSSDVGLALRRADEAARGGSVFGQAVAAALVLHSPADETQKRERVLGLGEAAESGHPWARWRWAVAKWEGRYVPKEEEGFMAEMAACERAGVWQVALTYGQVFETGGLGEIDYEKFREYHRRCVMEYGFYENACRQYAADEGAFRVPGLVDLEDEELSQRSAELVKEAVAMNFPYALLVEGMVKTRQGKLNEAMPYMLRAEKGGSVWARWNLAQDMFFGRFHIQQRVVGDFRDARALFYVLTESGLKDDFTMAMAASEIFDRMEAGEDSEMVRKAADLCRSIMKRRPDFMRAAEALSRYYMANFEESGWSEEMVKPAEAIWLYHCKSYTPTYFLAMLYANEEAPVYDRAKATLAAERAMKRVNRGMQKQIEERMVLVREKMTEEDRAEVARLRREGFPEDAKFKQAALAYLQEIGDLPAELPAEEEVIEGGNQDEVRRAGDEGARLLAGLGWFPAGWTAALVAPEDAEAERARLLSYVVEGKEVPEVDRAPLVRLLFQEAEAVRRGLEQVRKAGGEWGGRADELLLRLEDLENLEGPGPGDSCFASHLGWHISVEEERAFEILAMPLVCCMERAEAAVKAGFRQGDQLEFCEGVYLNSVTSRNDFVRLLRLWPAETPLRISVKRDVDHPFYDSNRPKETRVLLTLWGE
ncbi:MAG: hypothetical protein ACQKBY_11680 [Verrucomicrobiales bacterium]